MATKFTMTFDTGNAAFDNGWGGDEAADILKRVSNQLREGYTSGLLNDSNGNRVGSWDVEFPERGEDSNHEEEE